MSNEMTLEATQKWLKTLHIHYTIYELEELQDTLDLQELDTLDLSSKCLVSIPNLNLQSN